MSRREYVVGFAFSESAGRNQVVLIRKRRPAWQMGLLNGLGGKIEPGETPLEAMRREAVEEAGDCMRGVEWEHFADYVSDTEIVHVFRTFSDAIINVLSVEEEEVGLYRVDAILQEQTVPNLRWIVPMSQDTESRLQLPLVFRFQWG